MIKNYRLGVLICRSTISDWQHSQVMKEVEMLITKVDGLVVSIPGFSIQDPMGKLKEDNGELVRQITSLQGKGVALEVLPFRESPEEERVLSWSRNMDQIIGLPARGRRLYRRDRVWSLHTALNQGPDARPGRQMRIIYPWREKAE